MTTFPYMAAAVLAALVTNVLLIRSAIRSRLGCKSGVWMSLLSLVLCVVGARLYYILTCDLMGAGFFGPLFPVDPYSYAFSGGILGFIAAAALTARLTNQPFACIADAFVPAGLFGAALLRLAEAFSDFGWGDMLDAAWLQRYPFAIQNMYGEWCAAVFNLEALCALAVLVYVLIRKLPGHRLSIALLWWAASQIFCESLRVESIQWGFVRMQQLTSALIIAAVMLVALCRRHALRKSLVHWLIFAACVGVVIFVEYAIDKMPWATWIDYVAMAAAVICMGFNAQKTVLFSDEAAA